MTEQETRPARRRRWPRVLLALVLVGLASAWILHHYTRPRRLTALLVAQVHDQLGIDLSLGGDAGYTLVPGLRAELPKPQLEAQGSVLLRADALRAAVPWRTLWADSYEIERLELVRPVFDLDALRAWLAARPASSAASPDIRFALRIEHGTVIAAGKPIADDITMDLANRADLVAWLAHFDPQSTAALLPPVTGSFDAKAIRIGDTQLEGVHVEIRDDDKHPQ
jgi:uncharacterized protein involved in outer membrane biogenesis